LFSSVFSNSIKGKLMISGIGLIWFLGSFLLLQFYEIQFWIGLVDAFFFTMIFLGGLIAVEKIFAFYVPKAENIFLLLLIPLVLSFASTKAHLYLLQLIFENQFDYHEFLKRNQYLRLTFLAIAEISVALISLVVAKLEQQEEFRRRESLLTELAKEAELTQLKQQLQPHFLFNSLNSINALVVAQPQKAREMVLQLSDFLRATIRKDHQKWLELEEELSHLKIYLDIERVRFGHRLEVEFELEDETRQMLIPQILLQPLVENAIKHGLYEVLGQVKIKIFSQKIGGYLYLKISNPFDSKANLGSGLGFGLSSVERRLFLLFGRNDLLTVSNKGEIFRVELKIPQPK
jgi:two-component system, LytTR family, sensor kinase